MRNTLFLKYPDRKNYFFLINLSNIERIWKFLEAWESERKISWYKMVDKDRYVERYMERVFKNHTLPFG